MSGSLPYIGSRISLVSNNLIRYEGVLYTINTEESTITLQGVRSLGTEGRAGKGAVVVPPTEEVYDFIVFRGKDIKDLSVLESGPSAKSQQPAFMQDPAIVSVNKAPQLSTSTPAQGKKDYKGGWTKGWGGYGGGYQQQQGWGGWGSRYSQDKGGFRQPQRRRPQWEGPSDQNVGELPANVDEKTKREVEGDFDFQVALGKFTKPGTLEAGALTKDGHEIKQVMEGYNKERSFFDWISCDALDKQNRPAPDTRDKQREADKETFGVAALQRRPFPQRRWQGGQGPRGRNVYAQGKGKY